MKIAGLVLAAGQSRRFGPENKLLAPLKGYPLASHAARAMRTFAPDLSIAVACDPQVAALFDGFDIITPAEPDPDQSASLRAGMAAAQAAGMDAVLLTLADMPLIEVAHLAELCQRGIRFGAAGTTDGVRRMPPAFFTAPYFAALATISGDRGARDLLAALDRAALVAAPQQMLIDVDTPEQLAALNRR